MGEVRYLVLSCAIPLIYRIAVYGLVWLAGLGRYHGVVQSDLLRMLIESTAMTLVLALGEEIGWRGLLVPDLYSLTSNFAATCVIGGLVWAAWHFPDILYKIISTLAYILQVLLPGLGSSFTEICNFLVLRR